MYDSLLKMVFLTEQLLITLLSFLFLPVLILLLITIALASVGKSLGIRRRYVALLLRVFEYIGTKLVDQQENEEDEESDIEEEKVNQEQIIETESSIGETGHVIKRDFAISVSQGLTRPEWEPLKKNFELSDICHFSKCGIEAIIEDDVTKRFNAHELESWNLLTRSNKGYPLTKNIRLTVLWCIGFFVRYVLLFPFRLALAIIGILWLIVSTAFIGYLPPSRFKRCLNQYATLMCFRLLARSCSAVITFHNEQNKAKNGIVVANHTSPIDVIVLSCDNCYAMVGQAQGGLLGVLQRAMGRATAHVWFERSEMKDRHLVAKRLKEHVQDASKLPMLIFPEGTCINNTSVMMFKKGSFEVATTIYPVAIKYDLRFGDAFWDSSKHGMVSHLFNILTSWALVCDIWYLQPMVKTEREDAVEFANRVKREIAQQGGLVDLDWDGQLKRMQAKEAWKKKPQEQYSNMLKVE
ncbi:glycerol-3-phosphate acyltransferase 3-like [Pomacea canaliculata]|uniref:glycerol-3-phosphate acyltransferase 3-like n=1 Tax=Pomacea canaliculata TaxID=400727 RepID=UPI000D734F0E|nr:glycerol-3-phosphate acyltransferase 3-like [Pomacea canaliculata]